MITAIGKNVVAKAIYQEATKSGILLSVKEPEILYYEVMAVGKTVKEVKVGDKIFPPIYKNVEIDWEGDTLSVIQEENIYAKL